MSKDLIAYFDKKVGRNIKLIDFFRKVFFIINSKNFPYNKNNYQALYYLGTIDHLINNFYEANVYYIKKNPNQFLKQSLIEFNNALSHLSAGYYASETSWEKNIKKAGTHFHRGTLDYYKTIILDKDNLTISQKNEIVNIRKYEIKSIGVDIDNTDKRKIVTIYKEFANSL
jgi:hypothetical protein